MTTTSASSVSAVISTSWSNAPRDRSMMVGRRLMPSHRRFADRATSSAASVVTLAMRRPKEAGGSFSTGAGVTSTGASEAASRSVSASSTPGLRSKSTNASTCPLMTSGSCAGSSAELSSDAVPELNPGMTCALAGCMTKKLSSRKSAARAMKLMWCCLSGVCVQLCV